MDISMTAFAALLLCVPVLADDATARAQLIGAWQQQDDPGKATSVWVLEAKGDSLHITHLQGDSEGLRIRVQAQRSRVRRNGFGKKGQGYDVFQWLGTRPDRDRRIGRYEAVIHRHGATRHDGAQGDPDHW